MRAFIKTREILLVVAQMYSGGNSVLTLTLTNQPMPDSICAAPPARGFLLTSDEVLNVAWVPGLTIIPNTVSQNDYIYDKGNGSIIHYCIYTIPPD
jgi:hypothetical protein